MATHPAHIRPVLIALALLVGLTLASWAFAHVPLGAAGTPVALVIAAVKAVIVGWVFMELSEATTPVRVVALTTIAFIALLCAGIITDVVLR